MKPENNISVYDTLKQLSAEADANHQKAMNFLRQMELRLATRRPNVSWSSPGFDVLGNKKN